jgi:hypothetical protein
VCTLACAADLKPAYKAPPLPVAGYNWSGFCAGVSGGGAWIETAWSNAVFGQYSGTNAGSGGIFGVTGG